MIYFFFRQVKLPVLTVSFALLALFAFAAVGGASTEGASEPNPAVKGSVGKHLDNLEQSLDQRVAEVLSGAQRPRPWAGLQRHVLHLEVELREQEDHHRRIVGMLQHLRHLQSLANDPAELEASHQRWKARFTEVPVAVSTEKIFNGLISGRVTRAVDGSGLEFVRVSAENASHFSSTTTDGNGDFSLELPIGSYTVSAQRLDFQDELFDDTPCVFDCFFPNGDLVQVEAGVTVTGIDFALEQEGIVRGRVTDAETGLPLEDILVEAWHPSGIYTLGADSTDADGAYEITGLFDIEFIDYFIVASGSEYQTEAYDDVVCGFTDFELDCPSGQAQLLTAGVGDVVAGIDFELDRKGFISGRVTDAATGQGLPHVLVRFAPVTGRLSESILTDELGYFRSGGLDSREYWVRTENSDFYIDEIHNNVVCRFLSAPIGCDYARAEPVLVQPDSETAGIDFQLELGATITGKVTSAADQGPVPSVTLTVFDENLEFMASTKSVADGTFEVRGLSAGSYGLRNHVDGYFNEVYDDIPCASTFDCPRELADLVDVDFRQILSGVDFELDRLGVIRGRVVDSLTGAPIRLAAIEVISADGSYNKGSHVNADGYFEVTGLPADSYRILAVYFGSGGYISGFYPDVPCPFDRCDRELGGVVEVEINGATEVEVALHEGGKISGRVTDRLTGLPIDGATVTIYQGNELVHNDLVRDGRYELDELPAGQYFAVISGSFEVIPHVYGSGDCPASEPCDPQSGTPIPVELGRLTDGIDFQLGVTACQFRDQELCLQSGRFRLVAKWKDDAGQEGYARFHSLSNDSGYLYFFGFDNVEALVKVLDACTAPFDRFWVFAAGLTNLDVTLWVTDLVTLQTRTYQNAAGQPFQPIQDTNAFATCSSNADPPITAGPDFASLPLDASAATTAKACDAASGRLCLRNGRFAVEAFYQAPGQAEQLAGARGLTLDAGYFYFFDPDNVEVLVKVLDSCSFSDRFWVFGAGLTNVRVRLVVTDTETGEVREYTNEQGNAFVPIQDTQAFATCF